MNQTFWDRLLRYTDPMEKVINGFKRFRAKRNYVLAIYWKFVMNAQLLTSLRIQTTQLKRISMNDDDDDDNIYIDFR